LAWDGRQTCRPAQRSRVTGLCYFLLAFWSHWNSSLSPISCRIRTKRLGYLHNPTVSRFKTFVSLIQQILTAWSPLRGIIKNGVLIIWDHQMPEELNTYIISCLLLSLS
jgi:hypothetical protein